MGAAHCVLGPHSVSETASKTLPPKKAATVCGSAAPYRQLRGGEERDCQKMCSTPVTPTGRACGCQHLQLMDVVVFDVDVEVALLQQAVHADLQLADVFLHLVVINS